MYDFMRATLQFVVIRKITRREEVVTKLLYLAILIVSTANSYLRCARKNNINNQITELNQLGAEQSDAGAHLLFEHKITI